MSSPLAVLHPMDVPRYMSVLIVARRAVEELGLQMPDIVPDPEPGRSHSAGEFGRCYFVQGHIQIVLRFQDHTGKWLGPLPDHEVFETLAHELAHLRYGHHKKSFWEYRNVCAAAVSRARFGGRQ